MKNINIDVGSRVAYDLNKEIKKQSEHFDSITLKMFLGKDLSDAESAKI